MTTPAPPPPELVLSENYGGYQTDWYCAPPPMGVPFHVLREDWLNKDGPDENGLLTYSAETVVRKIYEIRIAVRPGQLYARLEGEGLLWLT